jgi:tRNA A-37 threonylcarbamoyl transferase component Bud32
MEIGHYTLLGQLPGGRYGAIWHARDEQLGREVALKQLALATSDRRPAIMRLTAALTKVQHPNLAGTGEPVENADGLWLVEEWITGASFDTVLASAGLTRSQALGVLHRTLEGLAEAHRHGLVHGTVSPGTIMITTDGVPKLVDFGSWRAEPEAAGVGPYASPEAFAGQRLTAAADVFSAGTVAVTILERFESLTGEVQQTLNRATSADPAQRQADAWALLNELDQAGERTFGAGWWTTEGIAAVVASSTGATLAAGTLTSTAGSGGAGVVSGSVTVPGGGAVGGAKATAGGAGRLGLKSGRGPLIAAGAGVVTLAVVAAGAYAITSHRKGTITGQPAATSTSGGQLPGGGQVTPVLTPTPTPTPTPKPKAQGFSGVYTYTALVTKSNWPGVKVGSKEKRTWTVRTTCVGDKCSSVVAPKGGSKFTLVNTAESWNTRVTDQAQCVDTRTQRPTGKHVPIRFTRKLHVAARSGDIVTKITGKARSAQLKKCLNQPTALVYEEWKITITYVKS